MIDKILFEVVYKNRPLGYGLQVKSIYDALRFPS